VHDGGVSLTLLCASPNLRQFYVVAICWLISAGSTPRGSGRRRVGKWRQLSSASLFGAMEASMALTPSVCGGARLSASRLTFTLWMVAAISSLGAHLTPSHWGYSHLGAPQPFTALPVRCPSFLLAPPTLVTGGLSLSFSLGGAPESSSVRGGTFISIIKQRRGGESSSKVVVVPGTYLGCCAANSSGAPTLT
jgi:hypothetical protein